MTEIASFTQELAEQGGKFLLERFNLAGTPITMKSDHSVVTEVDIEADERIASALQKQFPNDQLLSEELKQTYLTAADIVWVIDPLDGTSNYSLGLPFWGVSIARLVDGMPDTAALFFPAIGEMYTAQRGNGAYLNGRRLQLPIDPTGRTKPFFSCCSRTHKRYHVSVPYKARILGSAAYSFCAVGRGIAAVAFEATPKVWDLAGAWLVVEEAGGTIAPLAGKPPFPLQPGVDYRGISFPSLAGASRELFNLGQSQIKPRE